MKKSLEKSRKSGKIYAMFYRSQVLTSIFVKKSLIP